MYKKVIYNIDEETHERVDEIESVSSKDRPVRSFCREVCINIPPFLTFDVWNRYKYNISSVDRKYNDILTTLEAYKADNLYELGVFFEIKLPLSSVRIVFSTGVGVVFGSKSVLVNRLFAFIRSNFPSLSNNQVSILDTVRKDHVPPIPLFKVSSSTYQEILSVLPDSDNIFHAAKWRKYFTFFGVMSVPFWVELNGIYMMRICKESRFESMSLTIDGETYYTVDECFFLECE